MIDAEKAYQAHVRALLGRPSQTVVCGACGQTQTFEGDLQAAARLATLAGWRRAQGTRTLVCPACMNRPGAQSRAARRAAAAYKRKRDRRGVPA